ncbi:MAG: ABC transporter permease [Anaerolineae bacterium]|nr:ABC transporter permease [Anaerolineae bacterium]
MAQGQGLIWTLLLGSVSLAISFVLGNLLGIIGSWRRGGFVDTVFPPLLTFFGSFPYFWLAMLGLFVLGFQFKLFPLRHAYDAQLTPGFNFAFISSVISHLILPVTSVVLVTMGSWLLRMRNVMVGVLSEEFITLAEAKALPERRIIWNYAARNALLPNITALGISIGAILGGQLLTEVVFSYPGLGFLFLRSVTSLDYPLMQGLFLMITFGVLVANLIVDLTYARLDPRVRKH